MPLLFITLLLEKHSETLHLIPKPLLEGSLLAFKRYYPTQTKLAGLSEVPFGTDINVFIKIANK